MPLIVTSLRPAGGNVIGKFTAQTLRATVIRSQHAGQTVRMPRHSVPAGVDSVNDANWLGIAQPSADAAVVSSLGC